jgi:hypothetical protein
MGIVALVILSVTAAWSFVFGGLRPADTGTLPVRHYWIEAGRALSRLRPHQPPARKSIVVDTSGMAHPTADRTGMTKRDRSRPYLKLTVEPKLPESSQGLPPPAKTSVGAPLFQMQTEEMPLAQPNIPKPTVRPPDTKALQAERELSLGRKVQIALMADKTLTRSAQLTVRASSFKNRVTLRGIVLDQEEKIYIGEKAGRIAGPENVDNRLTVL